MDDNTVFCPAFSSVRSAHRSLYSSLPLLNSLSIRTIDDRDLEPKFWNSKVLYIVCASADSGMTVTLFLFMYCYTILVKSLLFPSSSSSSSSFSSSLSDNLLVTYQKIQKKRILEIPKNLFQFNFYS
jgi:hypothetical protein